MQYIYSGVRRGYGQQQNRHAGLSDRSSLKEALRVAAHAEHRSIANMIEVLIRGYCEQRGIAIPDSETENKSGERS